MGMRTVKHPFYLSPEKFRNLVERLVEALIEYHFEKGVGHLRQGQYLVLHRVAEGEYHIPVMVHVKKGYSGLEVYAHPLPIEKGVAEELKRRGVSTPYGVFALDYLLETLRRGEHAADVRKAEYIHVPITTFRSSIRYPPLREYADYYVANKLLQQREDGKIVLDTGRVFVGEYHEDRGWILEPFHPEKHDVRSLKTVYVDSPDFQPVAHVGNERYMEIRRRVVRRKGGVQKHF